MYSTVFCNISEIDLFRITKFWFALDKKKDEDLYKTVTITVHSKFTCFILLLFTSRYDRLTDSSANMKLKTRLNCRSWTTDTTENIQYLTHECVWLSIQYSIIMSVLKIQFKCGSLKGKFISRIVIAKLAHIVTSN